MREERLLERLERWERGDVNRSHSLDLDRLKMSVLNHLERLLNTRQGGVEMDKEYGIPDFTHYQDFPNLERDVATLIQRYEPRIQNVKVLQRFSAEVGAHVEFCVEGEFSEVPGSGPVKFTTYMTSSGRVRTRL